MKSLIGKDLNKMDRNEISRLVTINFLDTVRQVLESETIDIDTERDFSLLINTDQSKISKLKTDENRYVTLDVLAKAVNVLGMDANSWFVADDNKKKKLIRDELNITSTVGGNNNSVANGKNNTVVRTNTGTIYTAERIINGMSEPEQAEMKKYLSGMTEEVNSLKKTVDHYREEIRIKDKRLIEAQDRYIDLLESLRK